MTSYTITPQRTAVDPITVQAESYQQAALRAAHRLYGNDVNVIRTTGEYGKSGYFRAYKPVPQRHGGGQTSTGEAFHVS